MGKMEAAEQTGSVQPLPNSQGQTVTLRQLSTELQQGWIERLFSRLAALYGASFGRQWEGTNLADVKAVWAEKLGGFTAQHIGAALKSCDDRPYPPNLPEFIELCRQHARGANQQRMPASGPQLSADEIAERTRQLEAAAVKSKKYDYKRWCNELRERYLAGECLLQMQIQMASEAMNKVWENRQCKQKVAA